MIGNVMRRLRTYTKLGMSVIQRATYKKSQGLGKDKRRK